MHIWGILIGSYIGAYLSSHLNHFFYIVVRQSQRIVDSALCRI
jgi:hypothetical protein